MIQIATRRSYQRKQKQSGKVEVSLSTGEAEDLSNNSAPDQFAKRVLQEQTIRVAVERLPHRCRQVIDALFLEDPQPTYAELAQRSSECSGVNSSTGNAKLMDGVRIL